MSLESIMHETIEILRSRGENTDYDLFYESLPVYENSHTKELSNVRLPWTAQCCNDSQCVALGEAIGVYV